MGLHEAHCNLSLYESEIRRHESNYFIRERLVFVLGHGYVVVWMPRDSGITSSVFFVLSLRTTGLSLVETC